MLDRHDQQIAPDRTGTLTIPERDGVAALSKSQQIDPDSDYFEGPIFKLGSISQISDDLDLDYQN